MNETIISINLLLLTINLVVGAVALFMLFRLWRHVQQHWVMLRPKDWVKLTKDDYEELYKAAKEFVLEEGKASATSIQRCLGISFSQAAILVDMLEERGVVGPAQGAAPLKVLSEGIDDNLLLDAMRFVEQYDTITLAKLQRHFRIGYTKTTRLMDLLTEQGIIEDGEVLASRKVNKLKIKK